MSTNTKKKYSSRTVAKEVTDGSEGSSRSERRSSRSSRGSRQARPVEAESIGIPLPNLVFWLLIFVSVLPGLVVYLQRLWFDSIYGWLPILGFSAGIPLLLFRWDRNLRIPQSYPVILGLGAAVASGALFAIQGWTWFYFPCVLGCIGVFCASNQGKDCKPLVTSGWFGFALMSLPLGYMDQLLLISHSVIRSTAINVLRWQAIPHVDLIAAIGLPSGRLYVAEQLQALISWPLFLTIAMVYSAILKRSTFVALANIGLSYGAFLLFHIGLIVCVGTYDIAVRPIWTAWQPVAFLAVITFLLFLSAERGIRCLLAPISDEIGGSQQINPLVAFWNFLQGFDAYRSQERKKGKRFGPKNPLPSVFVLAVLLLLSQAIVFPRAAEAEFDSSTLVAHDVFEGVLANESIVDHRQVTRTVLPEQGQIADIWTTYLPSRTTQFTLVFEPEFRGNPASLYMKSGWILDERYLESGPSSGSSIALINDDLFGRLMWAYVTYDGELLPASSDVSGIEEPLITVLCMAVFLTDPSDEAVTEYQSEFVKFSAAVSQCLITGDTEEELATQ